MQRCDLIVQTARTWLGTPYRHQHRHKGHGCDCVGLIIGVGKEAEILPTWTPENWRAHGAYSRSPNPAHMRRALAQYLLQWEGEGLPPDGAVAWMGWRASLPMHLGIIGTAPAGYRTLIHAYSGAGSVIEHRLSEDWLARVESWWLYPSQ